ncbi:MAG: UDP-N-acetylglucosamine 1-carboxyvinyltransferase [Thermoguttaceae bacterium]
MMRNGNQLRNRKRAAGRCLPFPWPLVPGPRSLSWFTIRGGLPLHGEVRAAGSKNAALPMMAAAILADEPVTLERVPQLADVQTLARVLESLGMAVTRRDGTLRLETADPRPVQAPWRLVRRLRASFCVLGPLLARRGRAVVPLPGGCRIGDRPVDLHLKGLAALGADLRLEHGCVVARAKRLVGATIDLRGPHGPTVTGTANVLSAAVLARGKTLLRGAAQEPEIVALGELLNAMGARIGGLGTATLEIQGVSQLGGATCRLIADRIEAATVLLAAAITGGDAAVTGIDPAHLQSVLTLLEATGAKITIDGDRVSLESDGPPRPVDIAAEPYPGVPTDVQAQWTALMSLARGRSMVADRVFPARFQHVAELNRLGASITVGDGAASIRGVDRLSGAGVTASDLRASAALVLAGLAAEGTTTVHRIGHLDRGYERLDLKLRQLGARIERGSPLSLRERGRG